MKKFLQLCAFAAMLLLCNISKAQKNADNLKFLSYVFPSDSLNGFDEATVNANALQDGFFGSEYKVFMYRAKRNFINTKYGYYNPSVYANAKGPDPIVNAAPCVNEDFEASPVGVLGSVLAGWTISQGQNNGSCAMLG